MTPPSVACGLFGSPAKAPAPPVHDIGAGTGTVADDFSQSPPPFASGWANRLRPRDFFKAARVNVAPKEAPISAADQSARTRMMSWNGPESALSPRPGNTKVSYPA